ncbi:MULTISPECIES: N-6 DNA methylase [unclassified Moraxella]|uniref:N-6 DNA methylase n=1 Tax=unclassified Moraxella TaxID=2685852 RepID=UPI003AF4B337
MITQQNFINVLTLLDFQQNGKKWTKTFSNHAQLQVDFDKQLLIYPENLGMVVNGRQTCNFSSNENFVVFECVHRLLEKGYQPKHIELEKLWSLGHSQKSGRADICVFADDAKTQMLFIIECKTYGKEYTYAVKILHEDGGQLFSYWQQDRSTKWIALYASDIIDDKISYKNDIIHCLDDNNLIEVAKTDTSVRLYRDAHTKQNLHQIWQETYGSHLHDNLLFGEDSTAYHIGIPPLRKKALKDFAPDDRIINQFEEILRHNAVSDKENAFNRLIALFICKLVDEKNTDEHDEVKFQYKVGQDTYESLQDRLQQLYKDGMEKFMKEEIFYVPNGYAQDIFSRYQGGDRKHAINELEDTIRQLKFYTNNDFAFKDVHNKELFLQNGKILVEMVQLFEKYRIIYPAKHQFLGDLFEQLLNKGFKQNEGQFFTPSPITRFIWDCLPLQQRLAEQDDFPKVIDYACGSGHFLTEAVEAINAVKKPANNDWVRDHIFGVEKDYRLARVSQVSMFMNGAGDSNIVFGDGLDNHERIKNEQFDILVANPPYSVSAFKSHLKLKDNHLNLLNFISNNGGEIEVLFCERIAQLLKSGGIGAVILPSSILSNESNSYTAVRSLILSEFLIRAIVTLGSKTFGATGTNTVVLFLEKMNYPPKASSFAKDCSEAIFSQADLTHWQDNAVYEAYCSFAKDCSEAIFSQADLTHWQDNAVYEAYLRQIAVPMALYDKLRLKQVSWDELQAIDNEYVSLHRTAIVAKVSFSKTQADKLTDDEKNAIRLSEFLDKFAVMEQEKLYFFFLTYRQTTLVINAPSDNAKQKVFLGYDWSNRKGAEGIQIIKAGGVLYDDNDRFAKNTLASYVRGMYEQVGFEISDTLKEYAYQVNTADMLDFSLVNFNKAIRTSVQKKVDIVSKFNLVRLNTIINITRGVTYAKDEQVNYPTKNIILPADNISLDGRLDISKMIYLNENTEIDINKNLKANDIFICFSSGSEKHLGKLCLIANDTNYYAGGFMGILRVSNKAINPKYLYNILNQEHMRNIIRQLSNGSNIKNLSNSIGEVKIPLPPLDIQQKIIDECQKIDDDCKNSRVAIETYRNNIAQIFDNLESNKNLTNPSYQLSKLNSLCLTNPSKAEIRHLPNELLVSFVEMSSVSNDGYIANKVDKPLGELKGSYTYFAENDIILAKITPCMENGKCALATGLTNHVGLGSSEFHVFRVNSQQTSPAFLFYFLNREKIRKEAEKNMTGASGHRRVPIGYYENLTIPLPSIDEQKRIIQQIEALEAKIIQAQAIIDQTAERKQAILQKYL